MKRRHIPELLFVVTISIALLVSSFPAVAVSTNKKALPFFLENLLIKLNPDASPAKLDEIRNRWIAQLELNDERIRQTNGAVLNYTPSSLRTGSYLESVEYSWSTHTGSVTNGDYIAGQIDYYCGEYKTIDYDDEAFSVGTMSSSDCSGDVYVYSKIGPYGTGWANQVILFASDDIDLPFGEWDPIGYGTVTTTYEAYVWAGYTEQTFSCLAVCCWTPSPPPYVLLQNDVMIDMVWATNA